MDGWMTNSNVTVTVLEYYVTLAKSGLLIYLFIVVTSGCLHWIRKCMVWKKIRNDDIKIDCRYSDVKILF